jgi:hypothetical protein
LVAVREKKLVIKEKHLKVLTSFNVKSKRWGVYDLMIFADLKPLKEAIVLTVFDIDVMQQHKWRAFLNWAVGLERRPSLYNLPFKIITSMQQYLHSIMLRRRVKGTYDRWLSAWEDHATPVVISYYPVNATALTSYNVERSQQHMPRTIVYVRRTCHEKRCFDGRYNRTYNLSSFDGRVVSERTKDHVTAVPTSSHHVNATVLTAYVERSQQHIRWEVVVKHMTGAYNVRQTCHNKRFLRPFTLLTYFGNEGSQQKGSCAHEMILFESSYQCNSTYILWCWEKSTTHKADSLIFETSIMPRQLQFESACFKSSCQCHTTYILWCWEKSTAHKTGSQLSCHDNCYFESSLDCCITYSLWCWVTSTAHVKGVCTWEDHATANHISNLLANATVLTYYMLGRVNSTCD